MKLAILSLFVLATIIAQMEARPYDVDFDLEQDYDENDPSMLMVKRRCKKCSKGRCRPVPNCGGKREYLEEDYDENDPRMVMVKRRCKKCSKGRCRPVPNCGGKRKRDCRGKHCQTGPFGDKRDEMLVDLEQEYDENDPRMLMVKRRCKKCSKGRCRPVPNCGGKRKRDCRGKHCQTGPFGDKRDEMMVDLEQEYDENDPRMVMVKRRCKKCSKGRCRPVPNCGGKRKRDCRGKHCQTGPFGDK